MELPNNQPIHRQRHIPGSDEQTPHKDDLADHRADYKVQCKDGDTPAEGTPPGDDPEKHSVYPEMQTAQEPQQKIVHTPVLRAGGFEDEEQQHRRKDRQQAVFKKCPDLFTSRHKITFSATFL